MEPASECGQGKWSLSSYQQYKSLTFDSKEEKGSQHPSNLGAFIADILRRTIQAPDATEGRLCIMFGF